MGTARGAGASTAADAAGAGTASASAGADTAGGKLSGPSNSSKSKASPISMSELRKLDKALLADLRRLGGEQAEVRSTDFEPGDSERGHFTHMNASITEV